MTVSLLLALSSSDVYLHEDKKLTPLLNFHTSYF